MSKFQRTGPNGPNSLSAVGIEETNPFCCVGTDVPALTIYTVIPCFTDGSINYNINCVGTDCPVILACYFDEPVSVTVLTVKVQSVLLCGQ